MLMNLCHYSPPVKSGCPNAWTWKTNKRESEGSGEASSPSNGVKHRQVIETPDGQLTITFTPKKKKSFDRQQPQALEMAFYLWNNEFDLEPVTDGDHLVNKVDIFNITTMLRSDF